MVGYIYIIKNNINNKVYIGQTTTSIDRRWKEHLRHAKPNAKQVISKAMNKHGRSNFYIEKIAECDLSIVDDLEIYYIKKYNSTSNGYNVSMGGKTYMAERPAIDTDKLIYLYLNENFTLDNLSKIFCVTRYMITSTLKNLGIDISPKNSISKYLSIDNDLLTSMIISGASIRGCAKSLNMKYSTVRKAVIELDIEYNSSKSARHPDC